MSEPTASADAGPVGARYPASPAQEQWWFLDHWHDGSPAANRVIALRARGGLDLDALRACLADLVRRHVSLRTRFVLDGQRLDQVLVAPPAEILRAGGGALAVAAAGGADAMIRRIIDEETYRAFEPQAGILFAARLDVLGQDDHLICLTAHPSVADTASMAILARDLRALHAAYPGRTGPAAWDSGGSYVEFAAVQRRRLDGPAGERADRYWRAALAGAPTVELPSDYSRPATMSLRGERVRAALDSNTLARLDQAGAASGFDLRTMLLTAVAIVVARHAGSGQMVLGLSHSGRAADGTDQVVGPFSDLIPVRLDVQGETTIAALLAAVQASERSAIEHADIPFARIASQLDAPRDHSRHPVFQIAVELTVDLGGAAADSGCGGGRTDDPGGPCFEVVEAARADQRLDLWVRCTRADDGLLLSLDFATDVFSRVRIEYLASHLVEALRAIAAGQDLTVARISLLTERERRLIDSWQGEPRPPAAAMVHELFERQAGRTPQATAVEQPGRAMTYAELDLASTRLANHLRSAGIGPDIPVGMALERGVDALVAILGVLKAGGAYLPLDPTYPPDRLRYVLEDSRAPVLITRKGLLPLFGDQPGVSAVLVDHDADQIALRSGQRPEPGVGPGNLVYVMYTSGSTGRPKGVRTLHSNLSWYLDWLLDAIPPEHFRCVFGTIAFSFDVSAMDIWPPLLTGGRVRLSDGLLAVPDDSPEFDGVTLMNLVPSVLAEYLRHYRLPATARTITVGGEHLSDQLLADIFRRSRVEDVYHLYGPTETTVFVTAQHLRRARPEPISIGRPAHSTRIDILDSGNQITPVGVPGEVHVSGPCVADGYLGRPELTAQRFVRNPHVPGAVMYRTGDLARWRFDGQIEFLGRADNQVKIRGVRIELGEIEATIERHQDVAAAVVAVKQNAAGTPHLVGYVVAATWDVRLEAVRAFLQDQLPSFMIPTAFAVIDEVPRSPAGKVDRGALPAPAEFAEPSPHAAPVTPTERMLAHVWEQVLDRTGVGLNDNFFQIGGHSLLAIRVMREIETRTGVKFGVRTLFQAPVLGRLAAAIGRGLAQAGHPVATDASRSP